MAAGGPGASDRGQASGGGLLGLVARAIERDDLLPSGPVVTAFSGGPDSLCLLRLLADLAPARGWRLVAAHLDHGLRPESGAEVAVARELAAACGVPLRADRADVAALAARRGWSIEEAARVARYEFLARMAREEGAAPVATGHTQDDQAETLLLRLERGAGLTGLAAMRSRTELPPTVWGGSPDLPPLVVVRPLLGVSRRAIEAELAERGLMPLRDPSNADPIHARNRVRHELLPAWESIAPGVAERLARAASLLAEDEAYLQAETERIWATLDPRTKGNVAVSISRPAFLAQPLALRRRLLRHALSLIGAPTPTLGAVEGALATTEANGEHEAHLTGETRLLVSGTRVWLGRPLKPALYLDDCATLLAMPREQARAWLSLASTYHLPTGPSDAAIDAVLALAAGELAGDVDLVNGFVARRHGNKLSIDQRPTPTNQTESGPWMATGRRTPLQVDSVTRLPGDRWEIVARLVDPAACVEPLGPLHAHLTTDLLATSPIIRAWRPGDRIALPCMAGRKKLSDFFIDRKTPRASRGHVPLLVGDDTIAWIVGHAVGEPFRAHGDESGVLCCVARPALDERAQPVEGAE